MEKPPSEHHGMDNCKAKANRVVRAFADDLQEMKDRALPDVANDTVRVSRILFTLLGAIFCIIPFISFFFPNSTSADFILCIAIGGALILIGILGPRWFHLFIVGLNFWGWPR